MRLSIIFKNKPHILTFSKTSFKFILNSKTVLSNKISNINSVSSEFQPKTDSFLISLSISHRSSLKNLNFSISSSEFSDSFSIDSLKLQFDYTLKTSLSIIKSEILNLSQIYYPFLIPILHTKKSVFNDMDALKQFLSKHTSVFIHLKLEIYQKPITKSQNLTYFNDKKHYPNKDDFVYLAAINKNLFSEFIAKNEKKELLLKKYYNTFESEDLEKKVKKMRISVEEQDNNLPFDNTFSGSDM